MESRIGIVTKMGSFTTDCWKATSSPSLIVFVVRRCVNKGIWRRECKPCSVLVPATTGRSGCSPQGRWSPVTVCLTPVYLDFLTLFLFCISFPSYFLRWREISSISKTFIYYSQLLEDSKIKLNLSQVDGSFFHDLTVFFCLTLLSFYKSWSLSIILFNLVNVLHVFFGYIQFCSFHISWGFCNRIQDTIMSNLSSFSNTERSRSDFRGRLMYGFLFRRKMYCGNKTDYLW